MCDENIPTEITIEELFGSINTETNMLETRENMILCLAPYCIHTEFIHINNLIGIFLWNWCYIELYENCINGKKINIKEIFDKLKKNLKLYKLQDTFPDNIYEWNTLKKFTKNISPNNKLLISKKLSFKIKNLDTRISNFVEKVNKILDKYYSCVNLNFEQLMEIKQTFELSNELIIDSALKIIC